MHDVQDMTNLTILGSTGSIGASTLDVVARHPEKYQVVALTAYRQDELLFEQCQRFKPRYAVLLDDTQLRSFASEKDFRNCDAYADELMEFLKGSDERLALCATRCLPDGSGEPVRPSLGAEQDCDDLNNIALQAFIQFKTLL